MSTDQSLYVDFYITLLHECDFVPISIRIFQRIIICGGSWVLFMQDLLIQHTVDVMHTEKNIAENILKTLFGEKDTAKVKLTMQE